jgi:hypothetical protein
MSQHFPKVYGSERWKGIYETWLRRKNAYTDQMQELQLSEALRIQPAY